MKSVAYETIVVAAACLLTSCGGGQSSGSETNAEGSESSTSSSSSTQADPSTTESSSTTIGEGSTGGDDMLPDELPFDIGRPDDGEPPTDEEIAAFTEAITGLWSDVDYFRWVSWHSHGLHPSYDASMPSYSLWWQDVRAVKTGGLVTFRHIGGADNIMIRTPKVLNQSLAGYLRSGDPLMKDLSVGYSNGVVALFQGMAWGNEDPPIESIAARAIFTHDHGYQTDDGRMVFVDYDPVRQEQIDWNAHTVPNPANPHFGDIWIRNMRSKDDVPHMFRLVPVLLRAAQDAPDADVQMAAERAAAYLQAFAEDIVDHDYQIRTKEDGMIYVPVEDLAHFSAFECTAKVSAALVGKGDPQGLGCQGGVDPALETLAIRLNYFNGAILHYFHLAAIVNALVLREDELAEELLYGLTERADWLMYDDELRSEHPEWDADLASFLLAAAASGLPLTGREARLVQERYTAAAAHYQAYEYWDLWDESVPDGEYEDKPGRAEAETVHPRPEELTYLLQYCFSPWKNPNTSELVDCDVVLDPTAW